VPANKEVTEQLNQMRDFSMETDERIRTLQRPICAKLIIVGVAAFLFGRASNAPGSPPPAPPLTAYEERGPPTKEELGAAGWTLLHTLAANYPDDPPPRLRTRAEALFRALGDLYPCPLCAGHLRRYMLTHPPDVVSRESFSLWTCGAHNAVNRRNHKPEFFCDLGVLDTRWKDCGCGNHTASER
jgi:hypothetical protein